MTQINLVAQEVSSSQDLCIHHLIEGRAKRTPDAIAIEAPGRTALTYRRLHNHIHDVVTKLNAMTVWQLCFLMVRRWLWHFWL